MKNLAIIPARCGSKGVKDKNIKILNGKPLIFYSIKAALDSNCFNEVMVSTDSVEYADIAKKMGAKVPFLRSEKTSSDTSSSWDAVEEVLVKYKDLGLVFDTFALLQPTSPFRTSQNIIDGYKEFNEKQAKAIISVCESEYPPYLQNVLPTNHSLSDFKIVKDDKGRQYRDKYYRLNGALWISDTEFFIENHNLYREGTYAFVMENENSIDIDTELDFKIAEILMKEYNK